MLLTWVLCEMSIRPSPERNNTGTDLETEAVPARWHVLAPLIALIGGVFGILGAAYNELLHGSLLVAFVGAPMIEEALKPSGVYLLLGKWPKALRSQIYTALLAALGGVAFALIENVVYLNIYFPEHGTALVFWRYTVGIGFHTLCSFIFGFGINRDLLASIKGERKFLSSGKRFFLTAIILHSAYNVSAVFLVSRLGIQ